MQLAARVLELDNGIGGKRHAVPLALAGFLAIHLADTPGASLDSARRRREVL